MTSPDVDRHQPLHGSSSPIRPPGFSREHNKKDNNGSNAGTAPPGFSSSSSGERSRLSSGQGLYIDESNRRSQQQQQQEGRDHRNSHHNHTNGQGSNSSSSLAAALAKSDAVAAATEGGGGGGGQRTSSFVNLAAVLGTGLAESMDDAATEEWNRQSNFQQQQQPQPLFGSNNSRDYDPCRDLSFARQSRHAAARLIGASPPRADPLGLEAGGAFLVEGAPASLNHNRGDQGQQQQGGNHGNIINNNNNNNNATGLQAGFFSNNNGASDDALADFKASIQNKRADSPLGMLGSGLDRRAQPFMSKDVGLTVTEPADQRSQGSDRGRTTTTTTGYNDYSGGGVLGSMLQDQCPSGHRPNPDQDPYERRENKCYECEVERGMHNLWVDDNSSMGRSGPNNQQKQIYVDRSVGSHQSSGSQSQTSRHAATESEIRPFIWDARIPQHHQQHVEPSRCLAILRCDDLHVPEIRAACEAFGVLEIFRSDFSDRGIVFVQYYDIRSAQYAALELEGVLKRNSNDRNTGTAQGPAVYYCVPLNSSTQNDDSRLILADVAPYIDEHQLLNMLSSYGAVRSLQRQSGYYGGSSYEVEFHNVQDAKQAMLELSSTQALGPDVAIEVGMRQPIERKRGRELLATIGRWRHGSTPGIPPSPSNNSRQYDPPRGMHSLDRPDLSSSPAIAAPPETQLVLGADGRYSYMVVDNRSGYPHPHHAYGAPPPRHHISAEPSRQQIVHGPNGQVYVTTISGPPPPPPPTHHTTYIHGPPPPRDYYPPSHSHYSPYDSRDRIDRGPYYSHHSVSSHADHASVISGHSQPHHQHPHSSNVSITGASITGASVGNDDKTNGNLVLDLDAVETGRDTRTSLMVRNIPNKYTQQMLLNEFTENGLGPGVIDFFYLPIDFKNRCNRGYAFINFVDFKDILPFHRRYFGKHWSTFNSDKICDITYARIQGKPAMLKRFENSALMEKDEEYKPLVFISHGLEKGKRIPFPEASTGTGPNKS